jgi:hypothetical protein
MVLDQALGQTDLLMGDIRDRAARVGRRQDALLGVLSRLRETLELAAPTDPVSGSQQRRGRHQRTAAGAVPNHDVSPTPGGAETTITHDAEALAEMRRLGSGAAATRAVADARRDADLIVRAAAHEADRMRVEVRALDARLAELEREFTRVRALLATNGLFDVLGQPWPGAGL